MRLPNDVTTDAIAQTIMQRLDERATDASICPSEVARALAPDNWRPLMPQVRAVAAELAKAGTLRITQGSVEIAPETVIRGELRGPLRLRRCR